MNVLIVGKGGREHALAYAASRDPLCENLYCAPGNPGMATFATCVPVKDSDVEGLLAFAKEHDVDLTIVGPEATLDLGIADAFEKAGLKIFAPTKAAAQVESSKDFAKGLMAKYNIPTASYRTFTDLDEALAYVNEQGAPIVIKEDGLKAGKGVTVAMNLEDALEAVKEALKNEGDKVVIEEYLDGFEFSLIALVNGKTVVPLEVAQDHKRVGDKDTGPNTGGMGSYSPVRKITPALQKEALETIVAPMAYALADEGIPFTGFLYGGLMKTEDGLKTIEFNARFGDPEAEVILPRLESGFLQAIDQVMNNETPDLKWTGKTSHGVVLASTGYPAGSTKGAAIDVDEDLEGMLFHMGTSLEDGNQLVTDGGRVLMLVSLADDLESAMNMTYSQLDKIHSDELFYRHDIGLKDLEEK